MNIAIVGCGMMAEIHVKALRSLGYNVIVVIGRTEDRTKAFAKKNLIPNWRVSIEDTFDNFNLDSVHICTPPVNHYETIKIALNHKVHVICEKPFVLDEREAEELVSLAQKQGVINAVGFNVRFHEAIAKAQNKINEGKLGKLYLVNGSYKQEFHVLPVNNSWRYDKKQAGLMLATTEIGSHWIDLMGYLTSKKVEAVSATFGNFIPQRRLEDGIMYPLSSKEQGGKIDVDIDDTAIITFKLEGGTLANVVLSEVAPGRSNYLNIEINGSDGSFWWDSESLNHSYFANKKGCGVNSEVLAFTGGFNDSLINMIANIYNEIEKKGPEEDSMYATFQDGLMNIKICNAIYKSAHNKSEWIPIY
jgi:predicted dehydrogenase